MQAVDALRAEHQFGERQREQRRAPPRASSRGECSGSRRPMREPWSRRRRTLQHLGIGLTTFVRRSAAFAPRQVRGQRRRRARTTMSTRTGSPRHADGHGRPGAEATASLPAIRPNTKARSTDTAFGAVRVEVPGDLAGRIEAGNGRAARSTRARVVGRESAEGVGDSADQRPGEERRIAIARAQFDFGGASVRVGREPVAARGVETRGIAGAGGVVGRDGGREIAAASRR